MTDLLFNKVLTLKNSVALFFVAVFISLGVYGVFDILGDPFHGEKDVAVYAPDEGECVIRRVQLSSLKIALTFDDGPHGEYTEEILEILSEYNIKATFFVVGTNAQMYPELVSKELAAGHEVENHTFGHVYLKKVCNEKIKQEVTENQSVISEITHYETKFLRPPGGLYDERLSDIAKELDYKIVLWSLDTCDWSHPTPENIAATVLEDVRGGDIILMHDFIGGKSPTPMALKLMIPKLIERGFEFVTVSQLLSLTDGEVEASG